MTKCNQVFYGALAMLAGCATQPAQLAVPTNLVPDGERAIDRLSARGKQIYECRARPADKSATAWVYIAADLDLTDAQGRVVGKHTSPPAVWVANDGSRIVGEIKARADAPQAGAAPWLLVSTRSTGGEGRFAKVTSLQRVNTVSGVAPSSGCDETTIGKNQAVQFTSEYVLFTR